MEQRSVLTNVGSVLAALARHSTRPRYAFLVLQLVAEIADHRGTAGPHVYSESGMLTLRDWLVGQLDPISARDGRRNALRARVAQALADRMTGVREVDSALVDAETRDHVLTVGRQNVSRAISELVRGGMMTRHYAGYATNHVNRGGGRHAVYVLSPQISAALGRRQADAAVQNVRQPQFQFAA